jgi:hypothetical protein
LSIMKKKNIQPQQEEESKEEIHEGMKKDEII